MKRIKRLWMPMLLGVLLIATVVGAASARPKARPREQAWRVLTVPPSACTSRDDGHAWWHSPHKLECQEGGATCSFLCPVNFPAAGEQAVGAVNVKRLTMYFYDNSANDINAGLFKSYPPTGAGVVMAGVAPTGALADDPRAALDSTIVNNPVYRVQGPYIWVDAACCNIYLYGFFVHYTW
jgi:hypothetical protein